jgi:HEPN domain-containing protein
MAGCSMDEATSELTRTWLVKARADLGSARKLASGPDAYPDAAIYHCQQAAEKAVKGFLTFHEQRFEKVHNLPLLVSQAMKLRPGFSDLLDAAERLTPYATLFRYPGDILEPDPIEFEQALTDAEQFYVYILETLPQEVRP